MKSRCIVNLVFNLFFTKLKMKKHLLSFALPNTIPIDNPINLNHLDSWCVMSWLFDNMHMDYIHELISR